MNRKGKQYSIWRECVNLLYSDLNRKRNVLSQYKLFFSLILINWDWKYGRKLLYIYMC